LSLLLLLFAPSSFIASDATTAHLVNHNPTKKTVSIQYLCKFLGYLSFQVGLVQVPVMRPAAALYLDFISFCT
jgi:hypothetical protein